MGPHVAPAVAHMGVVMVLALFGNLLLILVLWKGGGGTRRRISPVQLLLIHTCVADIMFALLSLGTEILILLSMPNFGAPSAVCKLVRYLQAVPLYASPFLLVAISLDRYQAICRPLQNYKSDRYRRPNSLGLRAWALAFLCALPQWAVWKREKGRCVTCYGHQFSLLKAGYVVSFSTLAWLLPSALSAFFYFRVGVTVWRSKGRLERSTGSAASSALERSDSAAHMSGGTRDYVTRLHKRSSGFRNQYSEFDRKRLQTVRLTLTIIACNFFLWSPFCLANVLQAFAPDLLGPQLITLIVICGNLNSCVNPWIYILFNGGAVRRAFRWSRGRPPTSSFRTTNTSTVPGAVGEAVLVRRACSEHFRSCRSSPRSPRLARLPHKSLSSSHMSLLFRQAK